MIGLSSVSLFLKTGHDEEARVQLMKDIRLDAENPLGIDYEEFLAMQLFVSV